MKTTVTLLISLLSVLLPSNAVAGRFDNLFASRSVCEFEGFIGDQYEYKTVQYSALNAFRAFQSMFNSVETIDGPCYCEDLCMDKHSTDLFEVVGNQCTCTIASDGSAKVANSNSQSMVVANCPDGFLKQANECVDIDECAADVNPCGFHADCTNTDGSYECTCRNGYEKDSDTGICKDIDECVENPCGANADCNNKEGWFECVCQSGYSKPDGFNRADCTDIDECSDTKNNPCGDFTNSLCINTVGSFTCSCDQGYRGDPLQGKECNLQCDNPWGNPCGYNTPCIDTEDGFTCDESNQSGCPLGCPPSMQCGRGPDFDGSIVDKCVCREGFKEIHPSLPCVPV